MNATLSRICVAIRRAVVLLALLSLWHAVHGAEIDACSLLRVSDIQRIVAQPIEKGELHPFGQQRNGASSNTCLWVVKDGSQANSQAPLGGKSFVILNVQQWPAGSDQSRSFLEAFRSAAREGLIPQAPVSRGFGDEALWWGDGLAVRLGEVSFGVSIHTRETPAGKPGLREEALAKLILQALKRISTSAISYQSNGLLDRPIVQRTILK